ncbi:MAG: right-handed parallel beta-helix repeat-containing protein, partial [bacterium]
MNHKILPAISLILHLSAAAIFAQNVRVADSNQLRQALRKAGPGTTILVEKGEYQGGVFAESLRGTAGKPITIRATDAANRPVFRGGNSGWQLSGVSYLTVNGIIIEAARGNGLNIDDGGGKGQGSDHITLRNIEVRDIGTMGGNLDGIKLSGIDDFQIERCRVVNWGSSGSGIDMVGCHRGEIRECFFKATEQNQGTGVQAKGGSANVAVRGCRFENAGSRAVNIGGSTGLPYFRPANAPYEAKDIDVTDSVFTGSHA